MMNEETAVRSAESDRSRGANQVFKEAVGNNKPKQQARVIEICKMGVGGSRYLPMRMKPAESVTAVLEYFIESHATT